MPTEVAGREVARGFTTCVEASELVRRTLNFSEIGLAAKFRSSVQLWYVVAALGAEVRAAGDCTSAAPRNSSEHRVIKFLFAVTFFTFRTCVYSLSPCGCPGANPSSV